MSLMISCSLSRVTRPFPRSGLVENAKLQSDRNVFLKAHPQVGLALRCQDKVKGSHLAAVIGTAPHRCRRSARAVSRSPDRRSAAIRTAVRA